MSGEPGTGDQDPALDPDDDIWYHGDPSEEAAPADATVPDPSGAPRSRRRLVVAIAAVVAVLAAMAIALALVPDEHVDPPPSAAAAGASTPDAPSGSASSTSADGSTTRPPATTTTTPPPTTITLAFAGDLLPHMAVNEQAAVYAADRDAPYDFTPMLAPMTPIISGADVAICHMEVPVAPDQSQLSGYPAFGTAKELVDGAKAVGYDGCSTASNHTLDRGLDGIAATLDRFDQQGLHHAGSARTAEEGEAVTTYEVGDATVAHLSYAYGFNGYTIPSDAPFAVNQIDPTRIREDARRAREAGADLVVVSLHWGTEYQHDPSAYQRDIASQILPSDDIDLVIGHHAHVVQPIGQIDGTYVVWGLGNQLANQPEVPRSDGLMVVATATEAADGTYSVTGIEAVPTWVEPETFRVLPIVRTLQDPATPADLRTTLTASYLRTAEVLARTPTPGVTLAPRP